MIFRTPHTMENPKGLVSLTNTHLSPKEIWKNTPTSQRQQRTNNIASHLQALKHTGSKSRPPSITISTTPSPAHLPGVPLVPDCWALTMAVHSFPSLDLICDYWFPSLPQLSPESFLLQIPFYRILYFVKHKLFLIHILRSGPHKAL